MLTVTLQFLHTSPRVNNPIRAWRCVFDKCSQIQHGGTEATQLGGLESSDNIFPTLQHFPLHANTSTQPTWWHTNTVQTRMYDMGLRCEQNKQIYIYRQRRPNRVPRYCNINKPPTSTLTTIYIHRHFIKVHLSPLEELFSVKEHRTHPVVLHAFLRL